MDRLQVTPIFRTAIEADSFADGARRSGVFCVLSDRFGDGRRRD
jgi:hypothetical protein